MARTTKFPPVGSKWMECDWRVKQAIKVVRHDVANRREALAKLRSAVGDPLFVRAGNRMAPTAKALAMAVPLQQALEIMRTTLHASMEFDPVVSVRAFRIATTDYTLLELLPKAGDPMRLLEDVKRLKIANADAVVLSACAQVQSLPAIRATEKKCSASR